MADQPPAALSGTEEQEGSVSFDAEMARFYEALAEGRVLEAASALQQLRQLVVHAGVADADERQTLQMIADDCGRKAVATLLPGVMAELAQQCRGPKPADQEALRSVGLAVQLGAGAGAVAPYGALMARLLEKRAEDALKSLRGVRALSASAAALTTGPGGSVCVEAAELDETPHATAAGELLNFASWQMSALMGMLEWAMTGMAEAEEVAGAAAAAPGAAAAGGGGGPSSAEKATAAAAAAAQHPASRRAALLEAQRAALRGVDAAVVQHTLSVLALFAEDRRLPLWEARATQQAEQAGSGQQGGGGGGAMAGQLSAPGQQGAELRLADADLQKLDQLLQELSFVVQRCKLYENSLVVIGGGCSRTPLQLAIGSFEAGERKVFRERLDGLLGSYVVMERLWLLQSMRSAADAEVIEFEGYQISSLVEDVFFLLKTCLSRSAATLDEQAICATARSTIDGLDWESSFIVELRRNRHYRRLAEMAAAAEAAAAREVAMAVATEEEEAARLGGSGGFSPHGGGGGGGGGVGPADPSADAAAKALDELVSEFENVVDETVNDEERKIGTLRAGLLKANCTQLAARYAAEFAALTASAFAESFPACRLGDFMVSDLSRVATQLGHLNDETLLLLAEEFLLPALRADVARGAAAAAYTLDASAFDRNERHDPYVRALLQRCLAPALAGGALSACRAGMAGASFAQLVGVVAEGLAGSWEAALFDKAFNEFGAMQLSKELREVVDSLSALLEEGSVRPQFSRLSQLALVLNLERPSDVLAYRDSIPEEVFGADDIARALRLRGDMTPESIDSAVGRLRALRLTDAPGTG
jgi:hypothetical protein